MSLRVVHIVTGLTVGGAERMLLGLVSACRDEEIDSTVICLGPEGVVSELLERQGTPVYHLGLKSIWHFPAAIRSLARRIEQSNADVVQGWMYHGNLAATLASRSSSAPLVWNIRQSLHRPDLFRATTRLTIRANAWLSGRADSIIYNSEVARRQHESIGFRRDRGIRIPNGVDLSQFPLTASDRHSKRAELGIPDAELVVISVGRVHPIKGHRILMQSMHDTIDAVPNVRFLIVGRGASWTEMPFSEFANDERVRERTILMGERDDVPHLFDVADVFVSPSETEGFPNAVAEAMAARLPCVVTDVGDSAFLINNCGEVVPAGSAEALSRGLTTMLQASAAHRAELANRARARIESEFTLRCIAHRYAEHYRRLAAGQAPATGS